MRRAVAASRASCASSATYALLESPGCSSLHHGCVRPGVRHAVVCVLTSAVRSCGACVPGSQRGVGVQLAMEKVTDGNGSVAGYRLRAKRYRRRKPELRNGAVKWFDDKSYRFDLEDAPTEEDQRRLDIAWGVVRSWLRHYDPSMQSPPPDYDAVDANYYVTWSHFAEWVNTLLEHLPAEIKALQEEAEAGVPASEPERASSTRRSARTSDSEYAPTPNTHTHTSVARVPCTCVRPWKPRETPVSQQSCRKPRCRKPRCHKPLAATPVRGAVSTRLLPDMGGMVVCKHVRAEVTARVQGGAGPCAAAASGS